MKRRHPNKLPTCVNNHLLVVGNLTKRGACRICAVEACRRWYAQLQSRKVLAAEKKES